MPPQPTAPAELLAALARVLADWGAPWYVFGAQAVLVWGRPRLTADVDVTVQLVPEDPSRLAGALGEHGFEVRVDDLEAFVRRTRVLPFVHLPTGMALDIVLAGPGPEALFLARAVNVDFGGVTVPVISPEDLIVTKILAGRAKDWDDVHGVLAERGPLLDVDSIRATLAVIEDALGQSDLRTAFEAALTRARR